MFFGYIIYFYLFSIFNVIGSKKINQIKKNNKIMKSFFQKSIYPTYKSLEIQIHYIINITPITCIKFNP